MPTFVSNRPCSCGRKVLSKHLEKREQEEGVKRPSKKAKTRKSVRIDEDIMVIHEYISTSTTPQPTWLSQSDYELIRQDILVTLDLMEAKFQFNNPLSISCTFYPNYCKRGLECFLTGSNKILSLKPDTIHRREQRIRNVLEEQRSQRQQQTKKHRYETTHVAYNDVAMRAACLTNSNRINVLNAIEI